MNNVTTRHPSVGRNASRWLPWALIPVAGLFLVKLTLRPVAAVALIGVAFLTATASISIAIPLGLSGFAAPIVGILGRDPFPNKAVPLISFAWISMAIFFVLLRGKGEIGRASCRERV